MWNAASHTCVKTLDTRAPGRDEKIECVKGELQLMSTHVHGCVCALKQQMHMQRCSRHQSAAADSFMSTRTMQVCPAMPSTLCAGHQTAACWQRAAQEELCTCLTMQKASWSRSCSSTASPASRYAAHMSGSRLQLAHRSVSCLTPCHTVYSAARLTHALPCVLRISDVASGGLAPDQANPARIQQLGRQRGCVQDGRVQGQGAAAVKRRLLLCVGEGRLPAGHNERGRHCLCVSENGVLLPRVVLLAGLCQQHHSLHLLSCCC